MAKKSFFGFEDDGVVYLKVFFAVILTALIGYNVYEQAKRYQCRKDYCVTYTGMEIKGIVVEKYTEENTDDATLVILQNGWNKLRYSGACTRTAQNVHVSDSVYKKAGTNNFLIFRKGTDMAALIIKDPE